MTKKQLALIGFVAVDVIILVVFFTLYFLNVAKTAVLDILVAPINATVLIDGEIYSQGTYKTYPGETTAVISAEGFKDKVINLNLSSEETNKIYEFLVPEEGNLNYYAKNDDDMEILKKIGGDEAEKISKVVSIKNVLPIIEYRYGGLNGNSYEIVIDQDFNCEELFCLMVTGTNDKDEIDSLVKSKGYNPMDYKIRYGTN